MSEKKMSKVLLPGCSLADIPLVLALKAKGYYVITSGKNRDGLAHKYSDEYIYGDYSSGPEMLEIMQKNSIERIVSGCTDFSYIATAFVGERLGLQGHDSYEKAIMIHNKEKFKKAICNCGAYVPNAVECLSKTDALNAAEELRYPVIVKPTDLASGTGVTRCNNRDELVEAYDKALSVSRKENAIVEKFVVGKQHACSMFVINNRVAFSFVDNEQYHLNKYMVAGAYTCCNFDSNMLNEIIKPIERLFKKYNLVDGLFHVQFIEYNNHPYIIDVCRRTPGELYGKLVSDSAGIDYYGLITSFEVGESVQAINSSLNQKLIARECIMDDKNGIYDGYSIPEPISKYIYKVFDNHEKGCKIEDYLTFKAGIAFLQFDNENEMERITNDFYKQVKIKILPSSPR